MRLWLAVPGFHTAAGEFVDEPVVDRHRDDGSIGINAADHVAGLDDLLQNGPYRLEMLSIGHIAGLR